MRDGAQMLHTLNATPSTSFITAQNKLSEAAIGTVNLALTPSYRV
jgi:hypothetical protein